MSVFFLQASKTNSTNVKEASLLSFVKDVPVDLTVADKVI